MRFKIDLPRLLLEENFPFLLCFTLYLRAISKYKLPGEGGGGYINWRGDLMEGFLHYECGELIFGGAYAWRGLFSKFYGMLVTFLFLCKCLFFQIK